MTLACCLHQPKICFVPAEILVLAGLEFRLFRVVTGGDRCTGVSAKVTGATRKPLDISNCGTKCRPAGCYPQAEKPILGYQRYRCERRCRPVLGFRMKSLLRRNSSVNTKYYCTAHCHANKYSTNVMCDGIL